MAWNLQVPGAPEALQHQVRVQRSGPGQLCAKGFGRHQNPTTYALGMLQA